MLYNVLAEKGTVELGFQFKSCLFSNNNNQYNEKRFSTALLFKIFVEFIFHRNLLFSKWRKEKIVHIATFSGKQRKRKLEHGCAHATRRPGDKIFLGENFFFAFPRFLTYSL